MRALRAPSWCSLTARSTSSSHARSRAPRAQSRPRRCRETPRTARNRGHFVCRSFTRALLASPEGVACEDDDLEVTVTGPSPADPDGDPVTHDCRWFVDIGIGFFLDDEFVSRGNHIGECNTPPVIDALSDDTVDEGSLFEQPGSFTDPDVDTWMASFEHRLVRWL